MRASGTTRFGDAIATLRHLPPRALLAMGIGLACAGPPSDPNAPIPPAEPLEPGALRVRLVFGPDVDLDLYVTGPSLETVYFANDVARDGGFLEADRRCDDPAPRVETVVFPGAAAGDYRVGVDFMVRCDRSTDEAPYRIVIETPDGASRLHRGTARFGLFDSRVLERRVLPAAADR